MPDPYEAAKAAADPTPTTLDCAAWECGEWRLVVAETDAGPMVDWRATRAPFSADECRGWADNTAYPSLATLLRLAADWIDAREGT